jgi:hypothetical protein
MGHPAAHCFQAGNIDGFLEAQNRDPGQQAKAGFGDVTPYYQGTWRCRIRKINPVWIEPQGATLYDRPSSITAGSRPADLSVFMEMGSERPAGMPLLNFSNSHFRH